TPPFRSPLYSYTHSTPNKAPPDFVLLVPFVFRSSSRWANYACFHIICGREDSLHENKRSGNSLLSVDPCSGSERVRSEQGDGGAHQGARQVARGQPRRRFAGPRCLRLSATQLCVEIQSAVSGRLPAAWIWFDR